MAKKSAREVAAKARPRRRRSARRRAVAPNDRISAAINEYVPEKLAGTDRFLDIVNWNYCISRIRLNSGSSADVDVLSFGKTPKTGRPPVVLEGGSLQIRL